MGRFFWPCKWNKAPFSGIYCIAYDRLHRHCCELLDDRIVEVQYEDLVSGPEFRIRALLDRLNLAFEQACIDFHPNVSPSATAGIGTSRGPGPVTTTSGHPMQRQALHFFGLSAILLTLGIPEAPADELRVAVASNFKPAMEVLVAQFEALAGQEVIVSYGSTGKHYAQIVNGAPFDLFLAADVERPARLEAEGIAVAGSRFTYALGALVLWAPAGEPAGGGRSNLEAGEFRFLAIANPRVAPYGVAAEQVLRRLGVWESLQPRIVRGENIAQAYAYIETGNAELGFVALSQLGGTVQGPGAAWLVPREFYDPIEQQAVLLADKPPARQFRDFLRGAIAAELICEHGYEVP